MKTGLIAVTCLLFIILLPIFIYRHKTKACREFREWADCFVCNEQELMYEEIGFSKIRRLDEHLRTCAKCQKYFEEEKELNDFIGELSKHIDWDDSDDEA